MATFTIYDNAGQGLYMPYASATTNNMLGTAGADAILGDDGEWALFDMNNTPVDVAVQYGYAGGPTGYEYTQVFLVNGNVIGDITGLNVSITPGNGESFFNVVLNNGDDIFHGSSYSDTLHGGFGNDVVIGWGGNDVLYGDAGDDFIAGYVGDDYIDGGAGFDFAMYHGVASEYAFQRLANGDVVVVDKLGQYGADYLTGVEAFTFDDGSVWSIDQLAPMPAPAPAPMPAPAPALAAPQVVFKGTSHGDALTGNSANNVMYGYAGNDKISGGAGSDKLYGGAGKDVLTGGSGKDAFIFNTSPTSGRDAVKDFRVVDDTIKLDNAFFTKVGSNGGLNSFAFHTSKTGKAHDANDRIIYDNDSGVLYYDADGSGHGAAVAFATIGKNLALTHKDFFIL